MKNSLVCILSLSLLLFLSLPSPSLSDRCNPQDKKVLLEIKATFNFNNPYYFSSWNPNIDCCDWYGLDCDLNTSRLIALTIFGGNLSGKIPAAVGELPFLKNLMFRKLPNLNGTIPSSIAKLKNLRELRLSWTNLSGPVPTFITQLTNLYLLDLSFNYLTGSIPPSLSQLTNLLAIRLDRNKLTGEIPDTFGKFTGTVPDLYLSHNQLTGTVPKSLGDLNFTELDFSRNKLVGDISFLFGRNKTIQIVDFSRNMFEFNLSNVKFPASLTSLDLNHNMITGTPPEGLTALNFQYLNVSYNRLCGQIPVGGKLQNFDMYSYFHNRCLCGTPLPACK
ncbi:unnamed protein product [Ilex paraguariensis]|uniref:Polygalacturonase-inhibiting protein n=1 Tax=Ilex paraguariensis TaxID=185542 RepID=A0ABC8UKL2_9AQUA